MKLNISIGSAYYDGNDWEEVVAYVQAADRLGVDSAWSAEAWGMESVAGLGYLAHATENIGLGTGIMQVSARTPAMTAMTALSLNRISNGRFRLGLGASGPQVVEGLHGGAFAKPAERMREYIAIIRQGLAGERIQFEGNQYQLPRKGGEGKALKLAMPPKPEIPIYLATLGERALEMTGAIADGWLGTSFIPERSEVLLDPIRNGAESAGRSFEDIHLMVNATMLISNDVEQLVEKVRPNIAFSLGGMGSAKTNFYNAAYARAGFNDVCEEVQQLWVDGKREEAVKAVPDEMVMKAAIIGTEEMVIDRIKVYAATGLHGLRIGPVGKSTTEKITHLEQCVDLLNRASN